MARTTYDVFLRELDSIEELYVLSLWAYKHREAMQQDENIVKNPNGTLSISLPGLSWVGRYGNYGHLKAELRSGLPRELRSVLYIRVISSLEVFLIDSIKYAFTRNPFLLASQKRLEIPYSRLIAARTLTELQWDIVQKETRRLHSAGFAEVAKFYSSQLEINLSDTGINLAKLERAHDIRHLLVHRLGRTDESFRDKYGVKQAILYVTDQDLTDLITECRNVAIRLYPRLEERIETIPHPQGLQPFIGEIAVQVFDAELPPELTSDFSFVHRDQYLRNSDLFKLHRGSDGLLQYVFNCPYDHYTNIYKKLKKAARNGILEITALKSVSGIPKKRPTQPKDYLLMVAAMLPIRRLWTKETPKTLAQVLGLSNNKANHIITSILEDEDCLKQIGKEVHPEFTKAHNP